MIYVDICARSRERFLYTIEAEETHGFVATAWQVAAMESSALELVAARTLVVVPDFLNYARLLSTGQAKQMLGLAGSLSSAAMSGIGAIPAILRRPHLTAKQDFWVVADALLRYDLALLPKANYAGILLHSYLTDFASALNNADFLSRCMAAIGHQQNAGITTQQLPAALTAIARADVKLSSCSYLYSPNDSSTQKLLESMRSSAALSSCEAIADLSSLPVEMQRSIAKSGAESSWIVSSEFLAAG